MSSFVWDVKISEDRGGENALDCVWMHVRDEWGARLQRIICFEIILYANKGGIIPKKTQFLHFPSVSFRQMISLLSFISSSPKMAIDLGRGGG